MNIPLTVAISLGFAIVGSALGAALFFANQFTAMEAKLASIETMIQQNQAAVVDELGEEVKNNSHDLRNYLADNIRPDVQYVREFIGQRCP